MSAGLAACTVTPGRTPPPESLTMPEMALCAETVDGIAANAIAAAMMIVPNVCRPTVASFSDVPFLGRSSSAACYILGVAPRAKFFRPGRAPCLMSRPGFARVAFLQGLNAPFLDLLETHHDQHPADLRLW